MCRCVSNKTGQNDVEVSSDEAGSEGRYCAKDKFVDLSSLCHSAAISTGGDNGLENMQYRNLFSPWRPDTSQEVGK